MKYSIYFVSVQYSSLEMAGAAPCRTISDQTHFMKIVQFDSVCKRASLSIGRCNGSCQSVVICIELAFVCRCMCVLVHTWSGVHVNEWVVRLYISVGA